ncbi:hypothetical protein Nepgr_025489 [Nepenthes gracilis]|uniref:Uncharacterized protein n=1 Tax=Nepenthes gracilis TaxID=150966 RepID=A0AAD3T7X1_NEPGR|nr:hypothetical protein Nepgr_025489 [Nepenthes gracilis]
MSTRATSPPWAFDVFHLAKIRVLLYTQMFQISTSTAIWKIPPHGDNPIWVLSPSAKGAAHCLKDPKVFQKDQHKHTGAILAKLEVAVTSGSSPLRSQLD